MIEKMTKYSFILLSNQQDAVLESIQELGLVDITRSSKPMDEASRKIVGDIELINGLIQGLQKAEVPAGTEVEHIDGDIVRLAGGMIMRYSDDRTEIHQLQQEIETLRVWGSFDTEMLGKLTEAGVPVHFHKLSAKQFRPEWSEEYALSVVDQNKEGTWFVVAGEDPLPGRIPMPEADVAKLEAELADKEQHLQKTLRRLAGAKERVPELERMKADLCARLDLHLAGVAAVPAAENTLCVFEGFAPARDRERLEAAFDQMDVYWQSADATKEDNPPIKLKNNWFSRLFEGITGMYGMPVYDEFDPTPLLSIFFLLFFAMCLGDGGYGIVLILVGIAIHKKWLKIKMFENIGPLISVLGVATFFVGILMGTFFGIDLRQAAWVPQGLKNYMISGQIAGYDAQMVLALLVGVLHICLAMIFKTVYCIRRFGFRNSLSTLGWTMLIVGGVLIAAVAMLKFLPATVIKWMVIGLAVLSGLGIFIFNKPGRNPLLNIGAGLWDSYQMVTGILGDVLSYIRLYALGLAGGLLGAAFNRLGNMVLGPNPSWQWFFFVLILIVGHLLNLLMSCLGAFVHPLRLNFVEFFKNSGYEGRGLKYNPLKK